MKRKTNYDFSGWVTKYDVRCSDGRTIHKSAFESDNGKRVPLVWNHNASDTVENILGFIDLENRPEGVYGYGSFNGTDNGLIAKALVQHGDITAMSIYANRIKQDSSKVVTHGKIREVSLVLAGANPEAFIYDVCHSEDGCVSEFEFYMSDDGVAEISTDVEEADENQNGETEKISEPDNKAVSKNDTKDETVKTDEVPTAESEEVEHADEDPRHKDGDDKPAEKSGEEIYNSFSEEQRECLTAILALTMASIIDPSSTSSKDDANNDSVEHADGKKSLADIYDTFTNDQKAYAKSVMALLITDLRKIMEDNKNMAHRNCFDDNEQNAVKHGIDEATTAAIFADAKRLGSLKEAVLAHSDDVPDGIPTYGIGNMEYLFPEDHVVTGNTPYVIKRDMTWADAFMAGVRHSPFSRIKSIFADLTEDAARAKGYIKGNYKKEQFFSLLKRRTDPTTVYKKQKLDRDDMSDITDFDIAAWMRSELRYMLNEEIARASLIGDGRLASDEDHIDENHIRPIWKDDELFTIKRRIDVVGMDEDQIARAFIKNAVRARKNYKGSGNPDLFTTEDMVTNCLLLEDGIGHRLYANESELATALRVKNIYTVSPMESCNRTENDTVYTLQGIIVNLKDYTIGANKGGQISLFDDFDIDYNQQKYLIETRCSGALTIPYSAIAIETYESSSIDPHADGRA